MLEFMRHYGPAAGNVYNRPDVEVIQSEGRNFISRTERKFDVIFMGFVDTWASVASGGLSHRELPLHDAGDPGVLRSSYRRWRAGDHEMGHGYPASRDEHGVVPRRERGGKADRRCHRERDTPDDPAQMIFLLRKRPFRTMEGMEVMEKWSRLARPVLVPGPARGSAIRRSLRRPEIARGRHRRA